MGSTGTEQELTERIRVAERRDVPTVFVVDACGTLQSYPAGSLDLWAQLEPHVSRLVLQRFDELENEGACSEAIDGTVLLQLRAMTDGSYAVVANEIRVRDALRDLTERYTLTRRECDVARLLIGGASTAEIAESLSIATSTVVLHVKSIMAKTGSRSRSAILGRIVER